MDKNKPVYVLIVDDEGANRHLVRDALQQVGYVVQEAVSGDDAIQKIENQTYDVVLMDVRMQGVTLLRRIQGVLLDGVVILMTRYENLPLALDVLRFGAYDYLIKPSEVEDIKSSVASGVARVHKLRHRRQLLDMIKNDRVEWANDDPEESLASTTDDYLSSPVQHRMELGSLTVLQGLLKVLVADTPIDLTPTEFDLLVYLVEHRERAVPCQELVQEVRGYTLPEPEAREVIRPHVSNLRRKLKPMDDSFDFIINVRGIGYQFIDDARPRE
jgi:two-component system response regulator ResD